MLRRLRRAEAPHEITDYLQPERSRGSSRPPIRTGGGRGVRGGEPEDISNAIVWLVSDDARYITG